MDLITRRATFEPATFDEEARTVDVVWTTGATVKRGGFFVEPYDEELVVSSEAVRLGRLNAGAPFLRAHNGFDLDAVLGVVVEGSARVEDGQGTATIRLSDQPSDAEIVAKIRSGLIRNVSVGYAIHKAEKIEREGQRPLVRALDWEPHEISAVAIGADPDASTRAESAPTLEPAAMDIRNDDTAAPAAPPVDLEAIRAAAKLAEKARSAGIRLSVRKLGLASEFADELIAGDVTLDEARAKAIDKAAEVADAARIDSEVVVTRADSGALYEGMAEVIRHRANPGSVPLTEKSRNLRGLTLLDLARECLERSGVKTAGMSRNELVGRSFVHRHAGGAFHTVGDFANVLADTCAKELGAAYAEAPQTWRGWTRQTSFKDYRPKSLVRLGEAANLLPVGEHGEYRRGTIGDGGETLQLTKQGRIIGITREMILADDVDAFGRLPALMGIAAARRETQLVYGVLTGNPNMADGNPLFDLANHANEVVAAAGPDVAEVDAMRVLAAGQTGLTTDLATTPQTISLDIELAWILVPRALQTATEQFLGDGFTPATQATAIPASMRGLQMDTSILLDQDSTTTWYMVAAPRNGVDTLVYGWLDGTSGPQLMSQGGWDIDGTELKIRDEFGVDPGDFRGMYRHRNV